MFEVNVKNAMKEKQQLQQHGLAFNIVSGIIIVIWCSFV